MAQSAISGRALLFAVLGWLGTTVAATWLTLELLGRFAPQWKAGDAPTVLIVAEAYSFLILSLTIAVGGAKGLATQLGLRFTGWHDIRFAVIVWIAALCLTCLALALLAPVFGPFPQSLSSMIKDASDQPRLASADGLTMALIVIRAWLLAPLGEELLFRGALYGWLRKRAPAAVAVRDQ